MRISLHQGVAAFCFLACFILATTYGIQTWHARALAIGAAERETTNLDRSLSLQVTSAFQASDTEVLDMQQSVEAGELGSSELRRRLRTLRLERVDGFPNLYALAVLDRNGRVTASTQAIKATESFRDRAYFRFHRDHRTRAVFIGPPVRSKIDGHWILTMTRRVDAADGSFGGLVEAKISLAFFEHIFSGVDVRTGGIISLVRNDGILLARLPSGRSFLGRSIAKGAFYRAIGQGRRSGFIINRSTLDGVQRMTAFRAIDGYPMTLGVAFAQNEVLAAWWSEAMTNFSLFAFVISIVAFGGRYLTAQIRVRQVYQDRLARLASIDGLTGLANRRQFDVALELAWRRASRDGKPLALLMIDADHFKAYNDQYGHVAGDEALKVIARCIADSVKRPDDLGARYGGEEFCVILPDAEPVAAYAIAERLRLAIAGSRTAGPAARVTVSIGVASLRPSGPSVERQLVAAADTALYQAKCAGRDRTVVFERSGSKPLARAV